MRTVIVAGHPDLAAIRVLRSVDVALIAMLGLLGLRIFAASGANIADLDERASWLRVGRLGSGDPFSWGSSRP
jgi:hypothetical protein